MKRTDVQRTETAADPQLHAFVVWLKERGVSGESAAGYRRDVERATELGGWKRLLGDTSMAPKTRHRLRSTARAWADFTDDDQLLREMKRFRLPAAKRKTAKVPITREQLFALIDELAGADYIPKAMRAVLGMMACRGFRCGDVLRMKRDELVEGREAGVLSFEAKGAKRLEFRLLKTYRRHLITLAEAPGDWERVDELISPVQGDTDEDADIRRRKSAARQVARSLVKVGVRCGVFKLHPHRLRRTYAVEYLRSLKGDPEALMKLTQHMQWASHATALEYVDHFRGDELDEAAERIFDRE